MALSAQTPTHRPASLDDFLAIPAVDRCHEILDGELVRKALPSARHASAQSRLAGILNPYDGEGLPGTPGGWWLMTEVEILLPGRQPVRPDLAGWRRERMLELPDDFPVTLLPDWVCEVVSPSDPRRDTVVKYRDYARAGIPYYWLLDLASRSLTALKLANEHDAIHAEGHIGDTLLAEPFELVEVALGYVFGVQNRK